MSTRTFEVIAREAAAGISRRASLLTLGGAALAAGVTTAGVSEAKKKGKDCKKKEKQRCSNDAAACTAQIAGACEGEAACISLATLCCKECSADGFLTCVVVNQPPAMAAFLK